MYITVVPNRNSPPAILLRESFREDGVVKNRTLANLSDWAPERIEAMRVLLKGGTVATGAEPEVVASLAHGHVAAVLGMVRALLKSLATLCLNRIRVGENGPLCTRTTRPTPLQARAFDLIGVTIA